MVDLSPHRSKAKYTPNAVKLSKWRTALEMMATVFVAIVLLAVTASPNDSADPCLALSQALPGTVNLPNSTLYQAENRYWSTRQAEVHPQCFVAPRTALEVSQTVKLLTSLRTPFSVKSGGHTAFEGGSNNHNGVTIDLVNLNEITISEDRGTVSVGAGNRWINVSRVLDNQGLAVVGGRAADVGVGGLILGGGISFFSGTRGWACDNVRNYEIVVSSGQVVNASPSVNPDLYWALRGGGGSNFGIVTRFDLEAFPQGDLWASSIVFPGSLNRTIVSLFTDFSSRGFIEDPSAHSYLVMGYQQLAGHFFVLTSFFHPEPLPENAVPSVFLPFHSVPGGMPATNGTHLAKVSTLSMAIDQPSGSRQTWWDTSVHVKSSKLFEDIVSLFAAYVQDLLVSAGTAGFFTPFLVFQPISPGVIQAMQKNGGNALGLIPDDGPLMIVQLAIAWNDEGLDSQVEKSSAALIQQINELAKEKGLYRGFLYMNYAGKDQDVFAGYGNQSHGRLKATAASWDPNRVFQHLWRGYFKL